MIAVDTNILVYAHRQDAGFHAAAAGALRTLAEGAHMWALPWPCLHEFFAIVTHPRIYKPPTPAQAAMTQIECWLEAPHLVLLSEGHGHWAELSALLSEGHIQGPQVHDARIAALCLAHGVRELWTMDRDFSRFPTLTVRNPLTAAC
ncbi:MAG: type II toxin-antitoxin system VapC family toxin [Polyangiales bacterium]